MMTKNGIKILNIIESSHSHPTAEEIFFEMKKSSPSTVLATVYNNLNSLLSENKIRKISIEGCPDRYDNIIKHDHAVCSVCGEISDVEIDDITHLIKGKINGEYISYDLKIKYICPKCKNKE